MDSNLEKSRPRLLLADDSVTIRKVVELTFADEGIDVVLAKDGDEAMQKFVEQTPDIVLVDVEMPGSTGYHICEMIKGDASTEHIPVLLLVGSFEPFDQTEAERVGADGFLTKPFHSIRELVAKVRELLSEEATSEPTPDTEDIEELYASSFAETIELEQEGAEEDLTETSFADEGEVSDGYLNEPLETHGGDVYDDDEMIETISLAGVREPIGAETEPEAVVGPGSDAVAEEEVHAEAEHLRELELELEAGPEPVEVLGQETFEEETVDTIWEDGLASENGNGTSLEQPAVVKDFDWSPGAKVENGDLRGGQGHTQLEVPGEGRVTTSFDKSPAVEEEIHESRADTVEMPSPFAVLREDEVATEALAGTAIPDSAASEEMIRIITQRVLDKLSDKVIREIAVETVPRIAEKLIREALEEESKA